MTSRSIRGAPRATRESRSIHIGLNRVDAGVFQDILEDLTGAENDAEAMRRLANDSGCTTRVLLSEDATRRNVLDSLEQTISRLAPGDFLMITYAGHGTSLRGAASDPDGWDEAWCLYDGVLLDDELHDLLAEAPGDCDIVVVTDACFAGGIVDEQVRALTPGPQPPLVTDRTRLDGLLDFDRLSELGSASPMDVAGTLMDIGSLREAVFLETTGDLGLGLSPRAPRARSGDDQIAAILRAGRIEPGRRPRTSPPPPVKARVVSLAAAAEGELAFEGPKHGLFTAALVKVIDQVGTEELTYEELMRVVAQAMAAQSPTLGTLGTRPSTSRPATVFAGSARVIQSKPDRTAGAKPTRLRNDVTLS